MLFRIFSNLGCINDQILVNNFFCFEIIDIYYFKITIEWDEKIRLTGNKCFNFWIIKGRGRKSYNFLRCLICLYFARARRQSGMLRAAPTKLVKTKMQKNTLIHYLPYLKQVPLLPFHSDIVWSLIHIEPYLTNIVHSYA